MVWECSKKELVEDTALFNVEVVLDLAVSPIRQVLWVIVNLKALVAKVTDLACDLPLTV